VDNISGMPGEKLLYDGGCFVCRGFAKTLEATLDLRSEEVERYSGGYGLAHDIYLYMPGIGLIRGYRWVPPLVLRVGPRRILISSLIAGHRITRIYGFLRRRGLHPVPYLGRGKIPLKLLGVLLSLALLGPLYKVWRGMWLSR